MRPSITHIVPVYNGAPYLREALESLRAELEPQDEIIVSDDGSTDDSAAIAEAWGGARVIRAPNGGMASARNRALAVARGEWICLLDADDLALSDRIARLGARLLAADRPDLAYGGQRRFVSPDLLPPGVPPPEETEDPPAPLAGCILAWRRTFDLIGRFDESLRVGEFVLWLKRGNELGLRFETAPGSVIRRRRHNTNTSGADDYRQLMVQAVRRSLRRPRPGVSA